MSERKTVAVEDDDGQWWWFNVTEVDHWWPGASLESSELFRVAGKWILLDVSAVLLGKPARIIEDERALAWLTLNGHMPPPALAEYADQRKLR